MDALTPNNQKAPDFTLNDLDGHPHRLADYQGRIVILNFWSAECPWAQAADQELAAHLAEWGEAVTLLPLASNANEPQALLASAGCPWYYTTPTIAWLTFTGPRRPPNFL